MTVAAGHVYLRTGSNERKTTGSYYTPDYITRFIVERTLEPLLTTLTAQYATPDNEGHWQVHDPAGLRDAILGLNILDPATGSGHFMVEATAYLAEYLRGLALAPADLPPGEDELIYWKRQVVNACIYGVDINPLEVELAKLSLWLATLAQGKPLSFLDHHLKCGNTLVGARASEIGAQIVNITSERRGANREQEQAQAGQLVLLEDSGFAPAVSFAVARMAEIEQKRPQNVSEVKEQEALYERLNQELTRWKRIADVWVARHFGVTLDQPTWAAVRAQDNDTSSELVKGVLEKAANIARAQRFLHFDLEFPEVFYNPDGTLRQNPGFDAVIGNPPYVRQQTISVLKPFLSAKYSIFHNDAE